MQKTKKLTIAIIVAVALLLTVIFAFLPANSSRAQAQSQASEVVEQEIFNTYFNNSDGKCVSTYFPNGYVKTKKNSVDTAHAWAYHDTAISIPAADYSDLTQIWIELALVNGAYANGSNWWDQLTIATVDTAGDIATYQKREGSSVEGDSIGTSRAKTLGGSTTKGYTQNSNTRFWSNSVDYYILNLEHKTDVAAGNWYDFYNQHPKAGATSDATFTQKDLAGIIFRTHNDNNGRNEYNYGAIYGKKSDGTFVRLFSPAHATIAQTSVEGKQVWDVTANCVMENPWINNGNTLSNNYYDVTVNEGKYTITSMPDNGWSNWWTSHQFSQKDLSAYNGFSFYVDNTFGTSPIALMLFTNDGATKWFNSGNALFVPDNGEPYIETVWKIKAGFKGTIYVTFAGNSSGLNKASSNGTLGINFNVTPTYQPTSFVLRDFKFTNQAEKYLVTQYVQNTDGSYTRKGVLVRLLDGTTIRPQAVEEVVGAAQADNYVSYIGVKESNLSNGKAQNLSNVTTYYNIKDVFDLPTEYSLGSMVTTNSSQVSISGDTVTVQKASSTNSWTGVTFNKKVPTNIARYNGISFYIDLSNNTEPIFFNKQITEDTLESWDNYAFYSNYGAAMYYPDQGTPEYAAYGAEYSGHINSVPAGFKGTVVVPFVSFGNNGGAAKDHYLDLSTVSSVQLTFDRGVGGGSFTLKDFKLVSNAKVYVSGTAYFQKRDGDFGESKSLTTMSGTRVATLAGSEYEIANEVTIGGVQYVIDQAKSKIDPTDASNYSSTGFTVKTNHLLGNQNIDGANKNWGMGNAMWNYNPTVYYVYKDAFVVEKVFGLDSISTTYKKGTTAAQVLSQFPTGAVSVGNDKGGFMQISGEWRIEDSQNGYRVYFVPASGSINYLDPDSLLEYNVEVSTKDRELTAIEVIEPLQTNYVKGETLNTAGLIVTAVYDDGTSETLNVESVTISGFDSQTLGAQTITVTYGTFSDTYTVNVLDAVIEDETTGSNGADVTGGDSGCTSASVASVLAILGSIVALFIIKRRA